MIYFLRCDRDTDTLKAGWVKIGTTTRLSVRLKQIAVEIGHTPTVLAVLDGAFAEEFALHERFYYIRQKGEWFHPGADLLQVIEIEGRPWDGEDEAESLKAVKIARSLADMAFVIAKHRGVTISQYLTDTLRAAISRDYAKVVHEVDKRQEK